MRIRRTALVLAAGVLGVVGLGAPAQGAPEAGLRLVIAPAPSFVVGSQGGVDDFCEFGQPYVYSTADAVLAFRATSPSGITGYDVRVVYAGQAPGAPAHQVTNTPLAWSASNYDGGCGGGSLQQTGWRITAHDGAGRSVVRDRLFRFSVSRWNDRDATSGPGDWSFSAGWTRSPCACADGGSQNATTLAGRSGSYTSRTATAGAHLGLMMATGPGRGRADVYVDGVHRATVDTYAAVDRNRVYVWDSGPVPAGTHVVRVVNQATPGRPRIDVDAMGAFTDR